LDDGRTRARRAGLREYAERVLGLSARQTEERLRVGRALDDLPELERALTTGSVCWSVARELTRVATPQGESAWIDWARGRHARDIERAVAERRTGDSPDSTGDPARMRHRLAFEVRAETIAHFRDLEARVKQDLGEPGAPLDDDTVLFEIARRALGGPDDAGRASYQVAVSRCDACRNASMDAGGHTHPVDDDIAAMIACDAQRSAASTEAPTWGHPGGHPPLAQLKPSPRRPAASSSGATTIAAPSPAAGITASSTSTTSTNGPAAAPTTRRD
jgi:hypothetical protein